MRRFDPYAQCLTVIAAAFVWSAIRPKDYGVWIFELSLGLVGVGFLIATRRRYPFSGLAYVLAAIHFVILACGARYTYAEMPLFDWLRVQVHGKASLLSSAELVAEASGMPLGTAAFERHLRERYLE